MRTAWCRLVCVFRARRGQRTLVRGPGRSCRARASWNSGPRPGEYALLLPQKPQGSSRVGVEVRPAGGGRGSTLKTAGTRTLQVGAAHGPPLPRVGSPPGALGHWGAQVWRQAAPQDARWWCQPPEVLGGDLVMSEAGTGRGGRGCVERRILCVCLCTPQVHFEALRDSVPVSSVSGRPAGVAWPPDCLVCPWGRGRWCSERWSQCSPRSPVLRPQ